MFRRHWTPRYVLDRSRLAIHQRRHREEPWLTADAVQFLDSWITSTDNCLEWGAGRSTSWLAARAARVTSVEHDADWAKRVRDDTAHLQHVDVHLVDGSNPERYAAPPDGVVSVALALVDGIHRDRCALTAVDLVAPGGVIVVDNVERYLPSKSRAPEAIGDRYEADAWHEFDERTADWHRYWTTNGVTDTAFFFKPASAAVASGD
jgi:predicted O-methyltransferase YrrM